MSELNDLGQSTLYFVAQQGGETMFDTWLRALRDRPAGHCGPIYMR